MNRNSSDVLIAVPTRGAIQWATVTRLQEVRDNNPGLPPVYYEAGHLSVASTRNLIVKHFLSTECTVLVMVDDDVVPSPKFLKITDYIPYFSVVAVPTLIHRPELGIVHAVFSANGDEQAGVRSCKSVGTGCVAIDRELLEKLQQPVFEIGHDKNTGQPISDDIMFCDKVGSFGKIGFWTQEFADHHPRVSLAAIKY